MNEFNENKSDEPENFDSQPEPLEIEQNAHIREEAVSEEVSPVVPLPVKTPDDILEQFSKSKKEFEVVLASALDEVHQNRVSLPRPHPFSINVFANNSGPIPFEPRPMGRGGEPDEVEELKNQLQTQQGLISDLKKQHKMELEEWRTYEERVNQWKEEVLKTVDKVKLDSIEVQQIQNENEDLKRKVDDKSKEVLRLREALSKLHLNYFLGKIPLKKAS